MGGYAIHGSKALSGDVQLPGREKHGALIDTQLLAQVYLELRGGREAKLDLTEVVKTGAAVAQAAVYGPRPRMLPPRLTVAEIQKHEAFVASELKSLTLWTLTASPLAAEA